MSSSGDQMVKTKRLPSLLYIISQTSVQTTFRRERMTTRASKAVLTSKNFYLYKTWLKAIISTSSYMPDMNGPLQQCSPFRVPFGVH